MAYMCIYHPSRECDGCDECRQEPEHEYDPWDAPYDEDEEYCRYCDRMEDEE